LYIIKVHGTQRWDIKIPPKPTPSPFNNIRENEYNIHKNGQSRIFQFPTRRRRKEGRKEEEEA
jgi:hypothetical protein